jgi:hypothetical protein
MGYTQILNTIKSKMLSSYIAGGDSGDIFGTKNRWLSKESVQAIWITQTNFYFLASHLPKNALSPGGIICNLDLML